MIAKVDKHLVPMIMTFDEKRVAFICETLGADLYKVYNVMDFFTMEEDDD